MFPLRQVGLGISCCISLSAEDASVFLQATGTNASDSSSYVSQLALLLRDGNSVTGGTGVPRTSVIYIEHSNEVRVHAILMVGAARDAHL